LEKLVLALPYFYTNFISYSRQGELSILVSADQDWIPVACSCEVLNTSSELCRSYWTSVRRCL